MENIKKEIILLANSMMIELNKDDVESIYNEFDQILNTFENLKKIDTKNIEPTDFCIQFQIDDLRDDEIIIEDENPFSNCKLFNDQYVVIKNEK